MQAVEDQIIAETEPIRNTGTNERRNCFLFLSARDKHDNARGVESRFGLCHDSTRGRVKGTVLVAEGKFSKSPPVAGNLVSRRSRDPASSSERDIGSALRAAYDSAVSEDIPPEMLDLLSKLR
jgi:hypothetical protein